MSSGCPAAVLAYCIPGPFMVAINTADDAVACMTAVDTGSCMQACALSCVCLWLCDQAG